MTTAFDSIHQDLRFAIRSLAKRPGFTSTAILILSLGIGPNIAFFSVVRAVLLQASPFPDSDQMVVMWEKDLERERPLIEVSYANFRDWQAQSQAFEDMAAFGSVNWGHVLTGAGDPYRTSSSAVSTSFFETLSVGPLMGRTFVPDDDDEAAQPVVILSYGLWQSRLGGDPEIVGTPITLEGDSDGPELFTVVGVMPQEFNFPRGAELWTPARRRIVAAGRKWSIEPERALRNVGVFFVVGRIKEGMTRLIAETELNTILSRLAEQHGWPTGTIVQTPFVDFYLGTNTRPALRALWGAVGLILLIACANVVGLLLTRGIARERELTIRRTLGAGRARVMRQLLVELGLLTSAGGLAGLAQAAAVIRLIVALAPANVPGIKDVQLDGAVLAAAAGLCLVAGFLSGGLPAWLASSPNFSRGLIQGIALSTYPRQGRLKHGPLVVIEVAVALAVLICAGLMTKSLYRLYQIDLGYEPDNVLTMKISLPDSRYPKAADKHVFFEELLHRINTLPEVVASGAVYLRPLEFGAVGMDVGFIVEGQPLAGETIDENPFLNWEAVTPGYFEAMAIRLVEGRVIDEADSEDAPAVAVVGESLARRMWPGESPIGKRLWTTADQRDETGPRWRTVVGVVKDARYRELTATRLDLYVPLRQSSSPVETLVVRTAHEPLQLVAAVREQVKALDEYQPIHAVTTLGELVARAFAPWRFTTLAFVGFACLALTLAVVGLFSVLAYAVSQRTHEIALRIALGATSHQILKLVVGQGLILTSAGLLTGLVVAVVLTRFISGLLHDVQPTDPLAHIIVTLIVVVVSAGASYLPARRAAGIEPTEARRYE
jgi:predicted permease